MQCAPRSVVICNDVRKVIVFTFTVLMCLDQDQRLDSLCLSSIKFVLLSVMCIKSIFEQLVSCVVAIVIAISNRDYDVRRIGDEVALFMFLSTT